MQEGMAHICLVLSSMTLVRAKIEQSIPRKRHGNTSNHEKVSAGKIKFTNFDTFALTFISS